MIVPSPTTRIAATLLVALVAAPLLPARAAAQTTATQPTAAQTTAARAGLRPGILQTRIISASDSAQSYALYLPTTYDTTRTWPVLFLMDPRGRALVPMAAFRAAAEKFGYIAISSYNTISDGPIMPNVVAINAMLTDVRATLHPDPRRFYMVGFSGTARLSWDFAAELYGAVAGIFGAGASGMTLVPDSMPIRAAVPYFGTAGVYDFNYEEMRAYETYLRNTGVPHRIRYFGNGGHQWPPDSLATQGIEYFQLRAMRVGLLAPDSVFITAQFNADTARARGAEHSRHYEEALNRWREIEREYAGVERSRLAAAEVLRLTEDSHVIKEIERRREFTKAYFDRRITLAAWMARADSAKEPFDVKRAAKELRIDKLRKEGSNTRDPDAAEAAQRSISDMLVQLSFYRPREAITAGRKALALRYLDLAEILRPGSTLNSPLRAEAAR